MLCPEKQCCDGGRADYALLTFMAKCNDDQIAVITDWPSKIIQRCTYTMSGRYTYRLQHMCTEVLAIGTSDRQHEGIQQQGYSQLTYKVYMQISFILLYTTRKAKQICARYVSLEKCHRYRQCGPNACFTLACSSQQQTPWVTSAGFPSQQPSQQLSEGSQAAACPTEPLSMPSCCW